MKRGLALWIVGAIVIGLLIILTIGLLTSEEQSRDQGGDSLRAPVAQGIG